MPVLHDDKFRVFKSKQPILVAFMLKFLLLVVTSLFDFRPVWTGVLEIIIGVGFSAIVIIFLQKL